METREKAAALAVLVDEMAQMGRGRRQNVESRTPDPVDAAGQPSNERGETVESSGHRWTLVQ